MNNNPFSNKRAEARKRARERGEQTTQRNWDNYSVGGGGGMATDVKPQPSQSSANFGEINKMVNDAVAAAKASIVAEVVANVVSVLRADKNNENRTDTKASRTTSDFETVKAPLLNYEIFAPNGGGRSSIVAEIGFEPAELHVLGLRGEFLEWVPTEEC